MYIYYFIIIVWFLLEIIYIGKKSNDSEEYNKKLQNRLTFILFLLLFCICAFRAYDSEHYIGIDTRNYYKTYITYSKTYTSMNSILTSINGDEGYYLMGWILAKINIPFMVILIIEALLYVGTMYIFIIKYSKYPLLSTFIFICLGLYTFSFSTIRQSIAMGICLIAYLIYNEKKGIKGGIIYILLVLVSASFHKSSIIFLPAIFIEKMKYNKKNLCIFICIALLTFIFKQQFASFLLHFASDISDKYANYKITGENVGNKLYIFMIFFVLLRICFSKKFDNDKMENNLIYMMLTMIIIFPTVQSGGGMMRIYYYYYMFAPVYISNTLSSISDKKLRNMINFFLLIFFVWFFFRTDFVTLRLSPYYFNITS